MAYKKDKVYIVPDSVIIVNIGAFDSCKHLEEIVLPINLIAIGDGAFGSCSNLSKIVVPSKVEYIGSGAFRFCSSLSKINVDESNSNYKSIDGVLFSHDISTLYAYPLNKDNEFYEVPESVITIRGDVLYSMIHSKKLLSVTFPNNLTQFEESGYLRIYNKSTTIFYCAKNSHVYKYLKKNNIEPLDLMDRIIPQRNTTL